MKLGIFLPQKDIVTSQLTVFQRRIPKTALKLTNFVDKDAIKYVSKHFLFP